MAIDSVTMSGTISWTSLVTNTGFNDVTQIASIDSRVSPATTGGSAANRKYSVQSTLAAGANVTYDLQALTDSIDGSIVATRIFGLEIKSSGSSLKIEPGASNPLTWVFGGTTPSLTIPAGSHIAIGCATHSTVSGTDKTIKISNPGGTTLTYTLVLILGQ